MTFPIDPAGPRFQAVENLDGTIGKAEVIDSFLDPRHGYAATRVCVTFDLADAQLVARALNREMMQ